MRVLVDRIENCSIEVRGNSAIIARPFIALEIDTTFGLDESEYLQVVLATDGFPKVADPHPRDPTALVMGHRITAISGNAARGLIYYETHNLLTFGGEEELIIEDDIQLSQVMTNVLVRTRTPISVRWINQADPNHKLKERLGFVPYMAPLRVLTVRGHTIGRPPTWIKTLAPAVNSTDFADLGPAHWLFAGLRSRTSNRGRSYECTLTFLGRIESDWSEYSVIEGDDGQILAPHPSVMTNLLAEAYSYGIHTGYVGDTLAFPGGVTKADQYIAHDFGNLFPWGNL
jgi:hypothetical protein